MAIIFPPTVLQRFSHISDNPMEWVYNSMYNMLLGTLFPPDTPFSVAPLPFEKPREGLDFFQVEWKAAPVLVLTVKAGTELSLASAREEADTKIRTKLRKLVDACPLGILHGVSAIGTRLCFYAVQAGHAITPPEVSANDEFTDVAPVERWDCDLLEPEGAARFKAIISELHQACAKLGTWRVDLLRKSIAQMQLED